MGYIDNSLVTSLKYKLLIRLDYDDGKITNKEIIFKGIPVWGLALGSLFLRIHLLL